MSENTRRLIRERAMRDRERARASKARAWRPEDYEPDWDGPIRQDTSEGPTSAWRTK